MQSVQCRECGVAVLVEKFSWEHTGVQWTEDAVAACPVLAPLADRDDAMALTRGCEAMRSSIRTAAVEGRFGDLD
ncbi:hypothetical protein FK531_01480 [Rhodococcus spelaei]|uniref:Ferredoxin n=1 Tax=Rhodococcus spelaei TaxID=2546320 RepID=A0A541BR41_9NOCA|nr:hypothetical protein [Rhodococcus spelaei]TQF74790.1 hypothetical protein FK531_01480 [Rhodococcus spelaei]